MTSALTKAVIHSAANIPDIDSGILISNPSASVSTMHGMYMHHTRKRGVSTLHCCSGGIASYNLDDCGSSTNLTQTEAKYFSLYTAIT